MTNYIFYGLFSVIRKGRPGHPLQFLKRLATRNIGETKIVYYKE